MYTQLGLAIYTYLRSIERCPRAGRRHMTAISAVQAASDTDGSTAAAHLRGFGAADAGGIVACGAGILRRHVHDHRLRRVCVLTRGGACVHSADSEGLRVRCTRYVCCTATVCGNVTSKYQQQRKGPGHARQWFCTALGAITGRKHDLQEQQDGKSKTFWISAVSLTLCLLGLLDLGGGPQVHV